MSGTPGVNGAAVGTVRTRGGYDAFFETTQEPREDTGSSWRESVAGRNEEQSRRSASPARPAQPTHTATGEIPAAPEPAAETEIPGVPAAPVPSPAPVGATATAPESFVPPQGAVLAPGDTAHRNGDPGALYAPPTAPVGSPRYQTGPYAGPDTYSAGAPAHTTAGQELANTSRSLVPHHDQHFAAPTVQRPGALASQETEGARALSIALTSSELLADIAASRQAHLRSTTGMRGALNKVGFNLGLSPEEQRTESRRARIRRPLDQTYQIAVLNVKGGVGRTTTVAALASTFAGLRPDRVVAIDANPDFGDLAARTSRHPYGLTLRDLAQARNIEAFSAVQSFASITTSDLAVLASPWTTAAVEPLTGPEYLAGVEILRNHYNLLMIDCGTGVLDSATNTVLRTSAAVVIVTPATVRGVTGAVATLEWLDSHGLHRLAGESVIAIANQQPSKPVVEVGRIEELFAAARRPTFVLPYDEHLAEGGEIDMRLLQQSTALAFEELAAALADNFADLAGYGPGDRGGRW